MESTGHDSVVATARGVQLLRAAGLEPRVRIADLEARDRSDRRADRAYAAQGASPLPSGRSSYRRLGDYDADLARLAQAYPKLVRPLTLSPPSLEGRTLRGVEISDGVAGADGKPVFLMLGVHHAREWPSGEMSMEFAFDLAAAVRQERADHRSAQAGPCDRGPDREPGRVQRLARVADRSAGPGHQRGARRARHRRLPAQELPRRRRYGLQPAGRRPARPARAWT